MGDYDQEIVVVAIMLLLLAGVLGATVHHFMTPYVSEEFLSSLCAEEFGDSYSYDKMTDEGNTIVCERILPQKTISIETTNTTCGTCITTGG